MARDADREAFVAEERAQNQRGASIRAFKESRRIVGLTKESKPTVDNRLMEERTRGQHEAHMTAVNYTAAAATHGRLGPYKLAGRHILGLIYLGCTPGGASWETWCFSCPCYRGKRADRKREARRTTRRC